MRIGNTRPWVRMGVALAAVLVLEGCAAESPLAPADPTEQRVAPGGKAHQETAERSATSIYVIGSG